MRELSSFETIKKLSENPFDLTEKGALNSKRFEEFQASSAGLKLLYPTERVDRKTMEALFALAEETKAVDQLEQMQKGAILNKIEGYESEERMVLHTAMRDLFGNSPKMEEATKGAYAELEKLKAFLSEVDSGENFTDIVQVGIGGSDLGPRAIYMALESFKRPNRRVHFVSNVDPDDAVAVLKKLNLAKTLVVVVSKSGTTLETRTNENFFRNRYMDMGLDPKEHIVAVTGKGSPMDDPERYKESFYMWDYIGGRYSVTSMVGAVTIAFAIGMEKFLEFLRGASAMDQTALERDPKKNLPLIAALLGIWNRNFLDYPTLAIIPYSQAMIRFTAHLQQLDMESNGKRVDRQGKPVDVNSGPVIWGEPGTNGQHSFYQLIHQGTTIVPVGFIGFRDSQYEADLEVEGTLSQDKLLSNLFAQSLGLATGQHSDNPNKTFPGNRPNHILMAKQCDPYTLGAILAYFEHKVAFQGFIWNINSFDQEGVQLGKVLANQFIELFAKRRKKETIDSKEFPLGQAYLRELDTL
ncbi:MAG: glucose-6-phosphate isomerase [Candidatus Algichlamydia australiensis]|nr:glucose-6-phosphate isomerase [Chlamydiales bacterium]